MNSHTARWPGRLSRARMLEFAAVAGIMLAAGAAFWAFRGRGVQSGDYLQYLNRREYGLKRPIYHIREPGAVCLWQALTRLAPGDDDSPDPDFYISRGSRISGFALLGSISGAFFLLGTGLYFREALEGDRRDGHELQEDQIHQSRLKTKESWRSCLRLTGAAAAALAGAIPLVFAGHFEFYAPLYAALIIFYWRAAKWFRSPSNMNFAWTLAAAALAATMHRAAVFHFPALIWMFRERCSSGAMDGIPCLSPPREAASRRSGASGRSTAPDCSAAAALPAGQSPAPARTFLGFRAPSPIEMGWTLGAILAVCLPHIVIVVSAAMHWTPFIAFEDYNWLPELLTPITQEQADYVRAHSRLGSFHLFTFGSAAHWKHFFFFLAVGSPLAAPAVLAWIFRDRRPIRSMRSMKPIEQFLGVSALCGLLWALLWHPHFSYGDWDLFCHPSLPLNLLAARLILKWRRVSRTC